LNSGRSRELPLDRIGWETRGPYGEESLTKGLYPTLGRNCPPLFMRVITGSRPKLPCEPDGLLLWAEQGNSQKQILRLRTSQVRAGILPLPRSYKSKAARRSL